MDEQPKRSFVPAPILKLKGAINLYYAAVAALAIVVVMIPVLAMFAAMPEQVWGGWNICIGGLVSLLGAQSVQQEAVRNG